MKYIVTAFVFLGLGAMVACHSSSQQAREEKADTGILQAPFAPVFYDSLQVAMNSYYELTDGMTSANLTYIDKYGAQLKQHLDSLPLSRLQMDSGRLSQVRTNVGSISAELSGLLGEQKIDEKRKSFEMVSDMLYDVVKITGLKGQTIYRQYCPMAFDDRGAFWMSRSRQKQNPYFGNDMTACVEVADSLKY